MCYMTPWEFNQQYPDCGLFYKTKDQVSSTNKWQEKKWEENLEIKTDLRDMQTKYNMCTFWIFIIKWHFRSSYYVTFKDRENWIWTKYVMTRYFFRCDNDTVVLENNSSNVLEI